MNVVVETEGGSRYSLNLLSRDGHGDGESGEDGDELHGVWAGDWYMMSSLRMSWIGGHCERGGQYICTCPISFYPNVCS